MWVHNACAEGLGMKCHFSNVPGEALTLPWKSVVVAVWPLGVWEGCLYLCPGLEGAQALPSTAYPQIAYLFLAYIITERGIFSLQRKLPSLEWVGFYFTLLQVGEVPSVSSLGVSGKESIRTGSRQWPTPRTGSGRVWEDSGLPCRSRWGTDSGSLVRGGECGRGSLP